MSGPPPLDAQPTAVVTVRSGDPLGRAGLEGRLEDAGLTLGSASEADVAVVDLTTARPPVELPYVALVDEDARVPELLRAGAGAVLPRDSDGSRLAAAVHGVSLGLVVLDADLARRGLPDGPEETDGLGDDLTVREREVLGLLAEGLSNRRVARRLAISEHTAKFHVQSILEKLDVGTRTEAVVVAARLGLLWL